MPKQLPQLQPSNPGEKIVSEIREGEDFIECANRMRGKWNRWADVLILAFEFYVVPKMLLFVVLQGYYIKLQARLSQVAGVADEDAEERAAILDDLGQHRQLLRTVGVALSEIGPASMLGYSLVCIGHLIFSLGDALSGGYITRTYKGDSFTRTFFNHALAERKFTDASRNYLKSMLELNARKMQTVLVDREVSLLAREEAHEIISGLSEQQSHLRRLIQVKATNLWQATVQSDWTAERRKFTLRLFIFGHTSLCLSGIFIVFGAAHYANEIIERRAEPRMSAVERLSLFENYFAIYFGITSSISPAILLIVNLRDKTKFLQLLQRKFHQLKVKLVRLKRQQSRLRQQQPNDRSNQLVQLKRECDQEALQIYISLRIFIDQIRPTVRIASLLVNQCCVEMGLVLVIGLWFLEDPELYQLVIMVSIVMFSLCAVNMVFIICATFGATCVKTTHLAWSLVANMTDDAVGGAPTDCRQPRQTLTSDVAPEDRAAAPLDLHFCYNFRRSQHNSQPVAPPVISRMMDGFKLQRTKGSLINVDTDSLWRRFVEDMPAMHKKFSCTMFNLILLNYRELLSLNFWFLSVVMIFLTHK